MAAVHPPGPDPGSGPGPGPGSGQTTFNLGVYHQQQYRAAFGAALAAGEVKPLVIPWSLVGSFFLPLLYLSIPHTNRPWLYRMRWPVAAAVVYLNVGLMQTTSATNEAVAYATGLLAVWGTIWALRLLIFTRPQWEAARVERRLRRKEQEKPVAAMVAPDESVAAVLPAHEYVWRPFPATAPFLSRLGWTADLLTSLRGAGWNFSIPAIPHPPLPSKHLDGEPVRLDLIPLVSRTGTARSQTYASFFRSRLLHFTLSYLTIDFLTTTIRQDPYFVLGPAYTAHFHPLPTLYTTLPFPQLTIPLLRNVAALSGVIAGLHLYSSVLQLAIVFPLRGLLGAGADLWQNPTLFGGFAASVLDRGLAGFWGGWWHQTFRAGFVAPARWLLPRPHHHKRLRAMMEVVLAFFLSGVLHAAGGYTSITSFSSGGRTWTRSPITFFLLQAVGVILQTTLSSLLPWQRRSFKTTTSKTTTTTTTTPTTTNPTPPPKQHKKGIPPPPPRWLRQTTNLLFVLVWLQLTGWGLIDDMSRSAVWLFEPVPVSPFRLLGLGVPGGDAWWRWDGEGYGVRWWGGGQQRWWEAGVRL
ncbi:membrane bound O-acyl transferase family-domain-containing protein [Chaetomidium leptoderma]|uniref:Membrane bound O-acyl transferase family-domain-containing protein n=1 Tax=Chaetomidium leptoderma TaxID=669021 RepID=A0AAN7A1L3_9PEZI|nr:membrane bound O-acyl transferase family-domain-containing protein [Chaetomidium leptoderma]